MIGNPNRQIVQPWMFGHMEKKATGLELVNLPDLVHTSDLKAETDKLPARYQQRHFHASPGPERSRLRSITYQGLAAAMASQWGALL